MSTFYKCFNLFLLLLNLLFTTSLLWNEWYKWNQNRMACLGAEMFVTETVEGLSRLWCSPAEGGAE